MAWLLGLFGTTMSMLRRKTDDESAVRMLERLRRKIPKYSPSVTGWLMTYLEDDFFKRLVFVMTDTKNVFERYCIPEMQTGLYEKLGMRYFRSSKKHQQLALSH